MRRVGNGRRWLTAVLEGHATDKRCVLTATNGRARHPGAAVRRAPTAMFRAGEHVTTRRWPCPSQIVMLVIGLVVLVSGCGGNSAKLRAAVAATTTSQLRVSGEQHPHKAAHTIKKPVQGHTRATTVQRRPRARPHHTSNAGIRPSSSTSTSTSTSTSSSHSPGRTSTSASADKKRSSSACVPKPVLASSAGKGGKKPTKLTIFRAPPSRKGSSGNHQAHIAHPCAS